MPLWRRMTEIVERSKSTQVRLARVKRNFKPLQGVTLHENWRNMERERI